MMRRFYTIILYCLVPLMLLRLYWKGRSFPAYRQRILERFSLSSQPSTPVDIWLHAVSLGEVVAATPLIDALLARSFRVMVTTMTPTGSQRVLEQYGQRVQHQYLPYDLPWCLARFLHQVQPKVLVIMETELWPNLIDSAHRAQISIVLVNARISDQSWPSYLRTRWFFNPVLRQINRIVTQSLDDSRRFVRLGADERQVSMLGNMKFDIQFPEGLPQQLVELQHRWGYSRVVLLLASTHDDEEAQWLAQYENLKRHIPDLLILIAPRHPQRFQIVYDQSMQLGFKTGRRSQPETIEQALEVIVVDSLGELFSFYQLCHYAFVGGSLVPVGGHNVLEPMAAGVPVFVGPYMQNSKAICTELLEAKALQQSHGIEQSVAQLLQLHQDSRQTQQQVQCATAVLAANQGCVQRYLAVIEESMQPMLSANHLLET